ncbi:hypothetical protein GCM10027612_54940 [Microbispora bryophytorum subsp. camponoti]
MFATQAKVPRRREERERILLALADLGRARPDLDVVVKLRARDDERQTHNERHHYERLWTAMEAEGRVPAGAVRFAAGPMHEQLSRAAGFVTVSSTAALEAIAGNVPLLVLSDFGVSAEMINLVFEGSGCLGTLDDLVQADFRVPAEEWCRANYFHDSSASDWTGRVAALVAAARAGTLEPPARSSTVPSTRPPAAAPGCAWRCRPRSCGTAIAPSAGCAATSRRSEGVLDDAGSWPAPRWARVSAHWSASSSRPANPTRAPNPGCAP